MIGPRLQRQLTAPFRKKINRAPSPTLAYVVPWLSVMLFSLTPMWPVLASAPVLPPLGFLALLAWGQMRPGLLPVWAGLPLGLFDDLYSGQPFGSAILLWSLMMIALALIEVRFPWRGFALNWLVATGIIAAFLILELAFANASGGRATLLAIAPQIAITALLFPLMGRLVALFDRFRLFPFRIIA
jgi:rod shape-determining protein MreD